MITLKHLADELVLLSVTAVTVCGSTAFAQTATQTCRPGQVIPLTGTEPAAKIVIDAPLADPLASRGVVVIPYCAENMRIAPVFGAGALGVSPRVGHIHVTVDEAAWHWADASGTPLILRGLPPGRHTVRIELVDANHQTPSTRVRWNSRFRRRPRLRRHRSGSEDGRRARVTFRAGRPMPHRSDLNAARSSDTKRAGSSHAAKCPPWPTSLKYATPG